MHRIMLFLGTTLVLGFIGGVMSIDCQECKDANKNEDCTRLAACTNNEVCYTKVNARLGVLNINKGCVVRGLCAQMNALTCDRSSRTCGYCCSTDSCNTLAFNISRLGEIRPIRGLSPSEDGAVSTERAPSAQSSPAVARRETRRRARLAEVARADREAEERAAARRTRNDNRAVRNQERSRTRTSRQADRSQRQRIAIVKQAIKRLETINQSVADRYGDKPIRAAALERMEKRQATIDDFIKELDALVTENDI